MDALSKSRLLAFRQCPKRLWLDVHQHNLAVYSASGQAALDTGNQVGAVARRIYDPGAVGAALSYDVLGVDGMLRATQELLPKRKPIFEAAFQSGTGAAKARSLADVLLPVGNGWRMVEVKSSTGLKDYYRDDVAIQYHVATSAGLSLRSARVALVDSSWTYGGDGDYSGLLTEVDLTPDCKGQFKRVRSWIRAAHMVIQSDRAPEVAIGKHCGDPYECCFEQHCRSEHDTLRGAVAHPIEWLPRIQSKALIGHIERYDVRSLAEVPDELLNAQQLRVKQH